MWEAIVQGIIQGLTEFLPVSSSGHLVLAQHLFGFKDLNPAFNVFVQGGTALSLAVYYFPRLRSLKLTIPYIKLLIIATIPAVIAGLILQNTIESMFSSLSGLALGFILTTICILLPRYVRANNHDLTTKKAIIIGLAQAAAIFPSLSRSGATLGSALAMGVEPQAAFDFSFLMSIPVITGATIISMRHLDWSAGFTGEYLAGFAIAAVIGYFSLVVLAKITRQGKFTIFAPYTTALAILSFYLSLRQ